MKVGAYVKRLLKLDPELEILFEADGELYDITQVQLVTEVTDGDESALAILELDTEFR